MELKFGDIIIHLPTKFISLVVQLTKYIPIHYNARHSIYIHTLLDKLHFKFCKSINVLGMRRSATNSTVLHELGRFPLYFVIKRSMSYWYRLENYKYNTVNINI